MLALCNIEGSMIFSDLALARRLESTEAFACAQFAEARRRLFPECGSTWTKRAGTTLVFDGIDAPTTQSFGLGLHEELAAGDLDEMEEFFKTRGAQVMHEVCPLAGAATLDLLCVRKYRPFEVSSVLFRAVEKPSEEQSLNIRIHVVEPEDVPRWRSVSIRGWTHEHPELEPFVQQMGAISMAREQSPCFLAEVDGEVGAAGVLIIHEGVALFGGSTTVPELRRRGLQAALLDGRMQHAFEQGCDLAMMVAEAGSNSQRNAERKGFRVAYTRLKWRLGG
jgi:GNAT superfamily N-acetyltransferase